MERYIEGLSLHHWHRRQKEAVPVKHVAQRQGCQGKWEAVGTRQGGQERGACRRSAAPG